MSTLYQLPLKAKTIDALHRCGIDTTQKLFALTVVDILNFKNFGNSSVIDIIRVLFENGVILKPIKVLSKIKETK